MTSEKSTYQPPPLDLDPRFYRLDEEEKAFFQQLTGITDEEVLKGHILEVQAKAYEVLRNPFLPVPVSSSLVDIRLPMHQDFCIREVLITHLEYEPTTLNMSDPRLKVARLPAYSHVQKLLHERKDPVFLDLGCCFGSDVRKAVVDGWPVENVVASDLQKGFWDCGHELFKSTPDTFPAAFVAGDIFDPSILAPRGALIESADIDAINSKPMPSLSGLTSLTPLQGKVSVIHASSFFHLFSEKEQLELARRVSSLLLPTPGSLVFGGHLALLKKGARKDSSRPNWSMFCHSPESWREMWLEVFNNADGRGEERIKMEMGLVRPPKQGPFGALMKDDDLQFMYWSVTRA